MTTAGMIVIALIVILTIALEAFYHKAFRIMYFSGKAMAIEFLVCLIISGVIVLFIYKKFFMNAA